MQDKLSAANDYLMESDDEAVRLDIKTDPDAFVRQAAWCGVKPGMKILDAGCGPGRTTDLLYEIIQPGGRIVGVDFSEARIGYAKEHYGNKSRIDFVVQDLRKPLDHLGEFDLIWVRFVLEYFRKEAPDIVINLKKCLKPGGTLCLIDLDYNCLSHYELPKAMMEMLSRIMMMMDEKHNFDTYVGRKLYSFLYDGGFEDIDVELMANNMIFGRIKKEIAFDWIKKVEIAIKMTGNLINDYPGGHQSFINDFKKYLNDPKRFTYTPLLLCKGRRPLSE